MFLKAVPHSTGRKAPEMVPFLMQRLRVSTETSPLSKYSSIAASSTESAVSSRIWRYSAAWSFRSSGIGSSWYCAPRSSPSQISAFISTRSTTPLKVSSIPIGSCKVTQVMPSFSVRVAAARKKSAPVRSSLLMKMMRGTL